LASPPERDANIPEGIVEEEEEEEEEEMGVDICVYPAFVYFLILKPINFFLFPSYTPLFFY
jgi:hypothetical protein